MLVQSHTKEAALDLERLAVQSANPKARLQALATLSGLQAVANPVLVRALKYPHWAGRRHGRGRSSVQNPVHGHQTRRPTIPAVAAIRIGRSGCGFGSRECRIGRIPAEVQSCVESGSFSINTFVRLRA